MEIKRWKQFESHKQFRLLPFKTPKHDKMTKMYGVFWQLRGHGFD